MLGQMLACQGDEANPRVPKTRIELALQRWQRYVLPLNYFGVGVTRIELAYPIWKTGALTGELHPQTATQVPVTQTKAGR